jgi:hypothetical protein
MIDHRQLLADYGGDVTSPEGCARFARAVRTSNRIETANHYVGACYRLACRHEIVLYYDTKGPSWSRALPYTPEGPWSDSTSIHPCLIAAGFGRRTPTEWVVDGDLWRFMRYFERCCPGRPIGSSRRHHPPAEAAEAWAKGVPAEALRLGLWHAGAPRRRGRGARRLERIIRAARRTSVGSGPALAGDGWRCRPIMPGALDVLGRMSPEMQREALRVSGYVVRPKRDEYGRFPPGAMRPFGARDLDWEAIGRAHAEMVADPERRIAVAVGKRREQLVNALPPPTLEQRIRRTTWDLYDEDIIIERLAKAVPLPVDVDGYRLLFEPEEYGRPSAIWVVRLTPIAAGQLVGVLAHQPDRCTGGSP